MVKLLSNIGRLFTLELGKTHVGILNNRVNELAREYCNDVWIIVDSTTEALDQLATTTGRRIELQLGNENKRLKQVEDAIHEIGSIAWNLETDIERLLSGSNSVRQDMFDGLAFDALDALQNSGWPAVQPLLAEREGAILQVIYDTRDEYISRIDQDNIRLRELAQIISDSENYR